VNKLNWFNQEEDDLIHEIKQIVANSKSSYGYRRVTMVLRHRGRHINHKRVNRLMKEHNLKCQKFHRRSRSYSSYKGNVGKIAKNELNRQFSANQPHKVWVTDVTEFKVADRKLYLSPILDLFNSEIVSFSLSQRPTSDFTNESLIKAVKVLPNNHEELMIHSDQGMHYQHTSWVKLLEKHNIKQSMSRKGNCLDNSPIESFFGLLKQEMFHGNKFNSINELEKEIIKYIHWYNNDRIKTKLKGLSPVQYRKESLQLNQ
jgi:putative transposase